ncbi:hypothetical protein IFM47457_00771 [Aspergillus lentulus]|nr:hypothetical protein IFM47457_00771 [Aspergillus lentulus]
MEDKSLPSLPRVAFAETDLLGSESELAKMSSQARLANDTLSMSSNESLIAFRCHCEISDRVYASQTQPGGQNLHVSLYLHHYRQDLRIIVQFKSLLLYYCRTVLRRESYSALLDPCSTRSKELDDAIWRVWTFCDFFPAWKERDGDLTGRV